MISSGREMLESGKLGELLTSNMVIVRKRTVKIYDIWPDKDDEVTEVGEAISGLFVYEKSQMRVIFNAIICCRYCLY